MCTTCKDIMFIYENEIQKCPPNKGVNPFFAVIIDEEIFGADFVMNKILGINQYQKFIVVMNDVPVLSNKYKNIEVLAKPFSARMLLEKLASV